MPDEPITSAASGSDGGAGVPDSPGTAMPPDSMSDIDVLNQPDSPPEPGVVTEKPPISADTKPEAGAAEEINLSALEEGQPQWLAKVTDPAAKAEVEKLLAYHKAVSDKFKDEADLAEFFKDLP